MEDKNNMEMLYYIYQNSKIGSNTLKTTISVIRDKTLKKTLEKQSKNYINISNKTSKLLNKNGLDIQTTIQIPIIKTYTGLKIDKTVDNNDFNIAKSLNQTSLIGITDITKVIHKFKKINPSILSLGKELLTIEKKFVSDLSLYI